MIIDAKEQFGSNIQQFELLGNVSLNMVPSMGFGAFSVTFNPAALGISTFRTRQTAAICFLVGESIQHF